MLFASERSKQMTKIETARRIAEQAEINKAAEREAIRKEAASLVNWLHR
jgi:hypothetical protein